MWFLKNRQDEAESWAYINNFLNLEECEKIIKLGESLLPETATTFGGNQGNERDSKTSWIFPSKDSEFIFRKVTDAVISLNSQFFNFELDGFAEGFQFTKYEAPAGKYDLHIDKTYKSVIRKMSVVIQLSNPNDFEGGDLLLQTGNEPTVMKKEQGYLVMFPSYTLHGVTPVTKGTRYSLVAWITGPQFK